MANVPVEMLPGMLMNTTEYDSQGRYVDGNLVRFWRGEVRPVGGWIAATADNAQVEIDGVSRRMHSWTALNEANWLAIGSSVGVYAYDGSDFFDITPDGLPPGPESGGKAGGYGGGDYSALEYGTAREFVYRVLAPANWTMDNWGQDWVGVANWDGIIYRWEPGTAAAVPLADPSSNTEVPQLNAAVFITDERHMVAVGAGYYDGSDWVADGRRVAWSSQENYLEWNATVTNTAGDLPLQTDSLAVCGTPFSGQNLIWTEMCGGT